MVAAATVTVGLSLDDEAVMVLQTRSFRQQGYSSSAQSRVPIETQPYIPR
jgi:hypothetical protein